MQEILAYSVVSVVYRQNASNKIATECLFCPIQPHTYAAITCVRMEQRVSVRKQTVHQPSVYVLRATIDTTVTTVGWSEI